MAFTVVLDTNILFSATGWRGNPFQCVEQARAGKIEAVTCVELMEELAEKLELKLGFPPEQSAETLADYLSFLHVVNIPKTLNAVPRDPDDNAVLECAIESKAKFLVTGDMDLLELKSFQGVEIVRASEFLTILAKQRSQ
ncbi:MAG: putative toxin-antitoxin system toxin component, PIN family [Verrucomicrobia bacterium]|nr:putative toxin-antitoxin system toxin component, PIN family [Verrucomicrobiota bacterium]